MLGGVLVIALLVALPVVTGAAGYYLGGVARADLVRDGSVAHSRAMLPVVEDLYPEVEPYEHGMLDVGDGNLVYWEECGNRRLAQAERIRAAGKR
jgi:hypothetical protein